MQFQRAEMAGVQRGLQQAFAFGEILENGAGLVLAAAAADRGADDADQRGRMKRPLDEGDVAEHLPEPRGIRIAFGPAALMRQQHDRKIRPGRLLVQPVHQPRRSAVLIASSAITARPAPPSISCSKRGRSPQILA